MLYSFVLSIRDIQTPNEMLQLTWRLGGVFTAWSHVDDWPTVLIEAIDDANFKKRQHDFSLP